MMFLRLPGRARRARAFGSACVVLLTLALCSFAPIQGNAQTSNGVLREVFGNLAGSTIPDLTNSSIFPNSPTLESLETNFEAPSDWADNYGTRMRALLLPPVTGNYTFYIASDDQSELWLSTDDTPAHRRLVARVSTWTGSRVWQEPRDGNNLVQQSVPIALTNGVRYYIEALQKEGAGGDNVAVTWQKPGDGVPANGSAPIPGSSLLVYGLAPPIISQQPTNVTLVEGSTAIFTVNLQRRIGATFQWFRDGTNVPGGSNSTLVVGPLALADSGSHFRCAITNSLGNTNSAEVLLTVVPDTTPPVPTLVGNLGDPRILFVVFSEPVEPASALVPTNYVISGGVVVQSAVFGLDARTVLLSTTPMTLGSNYTITISNVRDRATTPVTMLPALLSFTLSLRPIDAGYLSLPRELLGPATRRHGVVISEVMYHPTNRTDGRNIEYIEIYNTQPWFEEIGGWRLSGAIDYVFPSNAVLAARSFLVVAANPADFRAVYIFTNVFGPFANSNGLQNSSGTLRLRNSRDAIVFEMSYSGDPPFPPAADGAGHSLVLMRPSYGQGDPRAWGQSDLIGGSPGTVEGLSAANFRPLVINEILAHTDPPDVDFVELFNNSSVPLNISGAILTDDPLTNKFVVPTGTTLPARGVIVFTEDQLGFSLAAGGETVFLKHPTGRLVIDALRFDAQERGVALGRFPDGAPVFSRLLAPTPGTNNAAVRSSEVVLNEIMFDPISGDADDEYVELFNRGTNAVDLSGWRLRDGISFNIPAGTVLAAGGYVVIARNAARLRGNYSNLTFANCLGDYSGSLANGGERIELNKPDNLVGTNSLGQLKTNVIHVAVEEVRYREGGRWGQWTAGGGSSLELRDARADRRLAPNWADSDESTKSAWVTVEATGVMDNGWADATQLHVTLMGPGEALIDNVEVIPQGGVNQVANGTFESGVAGWTFQGNHNDTGWESGEGFGSAHSLHLRAQGRGDSGANRVRVQLSSTLSAGTTVTLRARVRWLRGDPNILLRLRGNWMEAPGYVLTAKNLGTPGQPNSRAVANAGPAITEVRHSPALPGASQPVLVTAQVNDPDGLAFLAVQYRLDPSTNYAAVAMTNNGAGLFSTVIPAQPAGTTAAFFVQAADNFSPPAAATFPNDAPSRECVVRWGDNTIPGTLPTYRMWLTQTNVDRWIREEKMSNKAKDVTFIYGTNRIIYNAGAWFHGSPYHSPGYDSPVGAGCDYDMAFPVDDRLLGETDINLFRPGNGGGDGTGQAEKHGYWFGAQFGLPFLYHRPVFVFVNGQRRDVIFDDAQQPNGDFVSEWFSNDAGGDLHKVQLGFEFGDLASGASEPGYAVVGADLNRYVTTGGVKKHARYRATLPRRSSSLQEFNDYTNIYNLVEVALTNATLGSDAYTLAQTSAVDVEEWFKVHVTQHLYNNYDSFSYGGGQNAFIYKPERDTWKLLLWDVDFAFGGAANDPNLSSIGGAEHGPRNNHAPFERIYWQALIEAANGMMTAARSNPILDARYTGMVGAGAAVASSQGIKDFIAARRTFILAVVGSNQAPFAVTSNGGADFSTNRNLITLTGTAPLEVRTILINGQAFPVTWTTRTTWVIRVPLISGTNVLTITGVDSKGVPVTGVNATLRVNYTGADELPQQKVVINEIMYHPSIANAGYVEIFNRSVSNAFDLSGWRLDGADFTFPNGALLEPGAYKLAVQEPVIFAETYGPSAAIAGQYHGKLSQGGETLTLLKPGPVPAQDIIIDQVTYEDRLPWPTLADGGGPSLQLIDVLQDNNRSANWAAVQTNAPTLQWQYATFSGNATSSQLLLYLQSAGDVYVDDIKLVAGSVAEVGQNTVQNGDFESAFPGPWTVSPNLAGSAVSPFVKHSGGASLHLVSSQAGSTSTNTISQTLSPGLTLGTRYTLSFWFLQSPNGGPLNIRLTGSGIVGIVNLAPAAVTNLARFTPGQANSVRAAFPAFPSLWLNEVLPDNFFLGTNGVTDGFGERDPWVELYNGGTNAISLEGFYLSDNYANLTRWPFPAGASIGPNQFQLVWLDGQPEQSSATEWHANFRALPGIGSVVLTRGTNLAAVVDHLNYSVPVSGRSYGSYPDGAVSGRRLFSSVTPAGTNNPASLPIDVRINEWMADNRTALADPADGDFEDWFELYNPGTNTVDLTGCHLSDNITNATLWLVPVGTVIPPLGYLLVWADGETGQNSPDRTDLHAGFSLSKNGEAIVVFAPDGTVIDAVSFGPQLPDISQGRFPDGTAKIVFFTNSTPRSANLVSDANTPPLLAFTPDKIVDEGQLLTFAFAATDTNVPAQTLTFTLDPGAPAGTSVDPATGQFRWVPAEEQGPGVYPLTVRVTDNGVPSLSATQTFLITVNEVNNAPTLAPLLSRTVSEGSLLVVTNSATDPDGPGQSLTFSLDPGSPPGMVIHPLTGLITWTPAEQQGPGTYAISVRVTDNGIPPLSAVQTLSVFVVEINQPPSLSPIPDRVVEAGAEVRFTVTATDPDVPLQTVTFALTAGPEAATATLDANTGFFSWTPDASMAGTTNRLSVVASDHGSPNLTDVQPFTIIVLSGPTAHIERTETNVRISYSSVPGHFYRVEFKDQLAQETWTSLGEATLATGLVGEATDGTVPLQRFYRVVKLD